FKYDVLHFQNVVVCLLNVFLINSRDALRQEAQRTAVKHQSQIFRGRGYGLRIAVSLIRIVNHVGYSPSSIWYDYLPPLALNCDASQELCLFILSIAVSRRANWL